LLRVLRLFGHIVVSPFHGNRAAVEALLLIGAGLGLGLSSVFHNSVPEGLIALAALTWAGLRLFEASEEIGRPIRLAAGYRRVAATLLAALAITGSGESQELEQAEAVRDAANEAREEAISDAQSFADQVMELARQHREAAEATGQTSERLGEGLEAVQETFDLGDFDPSEYGLVPQEGPVLYVLVSLGMPDAALRRYAIESHELNATLVIRGFYGASFGDTQARIASLFTQEQAGGIMIDPRPFKAFGVTRVPAIVYAEGPIEPCGELGCIPQTPPHDIVRGNISLRAALDLFDR